MKALLVSAVMALGMVAMSVPASAVVIVKHRIVHGIPIVHHRPMIRGIVIHHPHHPVRGIVLHHPILLPSHHLVRGIPAHSGY
jgi:hypothetical protein